MEKRLRETIGGALRPGDPRRFLIEAMVGAIHADGVVDDREVQVLRRLLREHDLFAALPGSTATMLIDMATDAIVFADGARHRIAAIAAALPARTQRLAAYAMACEVCAADQEIATSELQYLASLRTAFNLSQRDHDELVAAARDNRAMAVLEAKAQRIRDMVPLVVDCLVLRQLEAGPFEQQQGDEIRTVLLGLPDVDVLPTVLDDELRRVLRASKHWREVEVELLHLALDLPDYYDRYWMMVYLLVFELSRGATGWQQDDFVKRVQTAFELGHADMVVAEQNARLFAVARPAS